MNEDIRTIVDDWPYRPGKISVRKILGQDGTPKIQMRLDLGIIQMEPTGRPDGLKPEGHESVLDEVLDSLGEFTHANGTDMGFELTSDQCRRLRDESLMYYHRYLACFILEDYDQVIEDTQRNIRLFDVCNRYGARKSDRLAMEAYRPYVIMMNTRAKALLSAQRKEYSEALDQIKGGLRAIRKIYDDLDQPEEFKLSLEVVALRKLAKKFRRKMPANELKVLERNLDRAIRKEDFERAAKLRDRIDRLREKKTGNDAGDASADE